MSQFEYLILLVSILVSLGLADLTKSLRDLVRPQMNVRWHGLPVTWAGIVLGYVLAAWWVFYRILQWEMWHHPVAFLPVLLTTLALYLLCAFALPDTDRVEASYFMSGGEDVRRIDLETFYRSTAHRRWFFGTAVVFSVLFVATAHAHSFYEGEWSIQNMLLTFPSVILPHLILAWTELKWVHWGVTLYSLGLMLWILFDVAVAL